MPKKILLTRHRHTEKLGSSLHRLFSGLDVGLSNYYDVVRVDPMVTHFTKQGKIDAVKSHIDCDVAFISDLELLHILRELGWRGRVLSFALGDLPRGAIWNRTILPYLLDADTVLVSSSADIAIWNWMFSAGPDVRLVHFGVDTTVFRPLPPGEVLELRERMGFSPYDRVILYSGRITLEKNVHGILDVFAELIKTHQNYHLLIAGAYDHVPFSEFGVDEDIKRVIESAVKSLKIPADRIRFLSHLNTDELVRIYNVADVTVNLTLHHDENFGYSQVESMACGTPVVVTGWGGLKDTVFHGNTGYLIPTWVTKSGIRYDRLLAIEYIEHLLESDSLRKVFGRASVDSVGQQFSEHRFVEVIREVIEETTNTTLWNPAHVRFSPAGFKFNFRFSQKQLRQGRVKFIPLSPHYESYEDEQYASLISNYASTAPRVFDTSIVSRASRWQNVSNHGEQAQVVQNDDPLWPSTIRCSGDISELVDFVYQKEFCRVSEIVAQFGANAPQYLEQLRDMGVISVTNTIELSL